MWWRRRSADRQFEPEAGAGGSSEFPSMLIVNDCEITRPTVCNLPTANGNSDGGTDVTKLTSAVDVVNPMSGEVQHSLPNQSSGFLSSQRARKRFACRRLVARYS